MSAAAAAPVVDILKASSQISGLISAVGLEQAWAAVANATEQQLSSGERDAVTREIATLQLVKATDMIKQAGLTPEVVQLLQMLLGLIAPDPGLAPDAAPTEQAAAPAELEQARKPTAPTPAVAPAAPAAPSPAAPAQKDLPAPLEQAATPHTDPPADLPDANAGKYGQTAEGEPSFDSTGKTQKDLPPPQKDAEPGSARKDPNLQTPRVDTVRGGTGGGGKEGGESDPLPGAQSDAGPASPQRDPMPSTPTRKAAELGPGEVTNDPTKDPRTGLPKAGTAGWWHQGDIGRKSSPLLDRPKSRRKTTG